MATVTLASYLMEPRVNETGVVPKPFTISATVPTGDVVLLGKIPNRAVILDGAFGRTGAAGNVTLFLSASLGSAVLATGVTSGVARLTPAMLNYQVSISDDAAVKFMKLKAIVASATVVDVPIHGYVNYTMGDRK